MSPGSVRASESKRTSESIAGAASQDYNEVREDFQKLVEEVESPSTPTVGAVLKWRAHDLRSWIYVRMVKVKPW